LKSCRAAAFALAFSFLSFRADAAPITIGLGAFSGSETVLTFDDQPNGDPIALDYAALGV
jgi:hypothetical protein